MTNFLIYDIIYIVKERSTPRTADISCRRKRYNMATIKTNRDFLNAVIKADVSKDITEFAQTQMTK